MMNSVDPSGCLFVLSSLVVHSQEALLFRTGDGRVGRVRPSIFGGVAAPYQLFRRNWRSVRARTSACEHRGAFIHIKSTLNH